MPFNTMEVTDDTRSNATRASTVATSSCTTQPGAPSSSNAATSPGGIAYVSLGNAHTTNASEYPDSRPSCFHNCVYGPHTSTIRMNPYVRCVHDSGVPEIRSLKELLSLKNQPDLAEPDTPCLRPTHGPPSTWQGPGDRTPNAAATGVSAFREDPISAALATPTDATNAALLTKANRQASSPMLVFTADSVATPNTFATVVTHEKRIISRLTRRLRSSVKQHHDMPLGEPTEMVLSEGDEEDEEGKEKNNADLVQEPGNDNSSVGAFFEVDNDNDGGGDVGEVPMLPCSTREKAAEEEARNTDLAAMSTTSTTTNGTRSRSNATTADTTSQTEVSPARPCTPSPMQQRQWLMQENNKRIISPRSSSGMLCDYPDAPHGQPLQHAHSATNLHSLSLNHNPHASQQGRCSHHATMPTAGFRTYPTPVAKLEESPYHYIMRNYIGGTFLYYSTAESKEYFLHLCHRVVAQVRPLLEQETLSPHHGLFSRISAPAYVFGDIHGNFEDLSFFLKRLLIFHDFNLTPANILCLGDYVDRGPFSLECVMLLFSLKIMNSSKIVMLRGNHEDRVVCGDLQTYGRGCFLGQCQTVFGYTEGMKLFKEVTALFKYLPLAAELVIPSTPNIGFLRSQQKTMHPNLYVSQPAVLLHDATPTSEAPPSFPRVDDTLPTYSSSPYCARYLHPGGKVASGDSGNGVLSKGTSCIPAPPPAAPTAVAAGYSTIADAPLARGQPSCHEAHEERILCAHGGIPRFDRPPLEENALRSLRSLAFPRMLTLFPNNPMVMNDPECAPDYFAQKELPRLWRRYPSTAPPEFTAAARREAAESAAVAAAATASTGMSASPPAACSVKARKLNSRASSVALPSECGNNGKERASFDSSSSYSTLGQLERGQSASPFSAAASSASLLCATPHTCPEKDDTLQPGRQLLHRCRSRDFLPLPTEEEIKKAWYTMFDLLWSDPTPMELEEESAAGGVCTTAAGAASASRTRINEWGFGVNTRGSNVVSFSAKAVDMFLTAHHYSMLFRAHQEKAHGLRWSKSNKVLTIFSSSNYMGHGNGAGCVVVAANGELQMVEKVCL